VLAGKGPLRRAKSGAPLPAPRRSGEQRGRRAAPAGTRSTRSPPGPAVDNDNALSELLT